MITKIVIPMDNGQVPYINSITVDKNNNLYVGLGRTYHGHVTIEGGNVLKYTPTQNSNSSNLLALKHKLIINI